MNPGADPGLLRPAPDEIHDLIPRIVRDPDPGQRSQYVLSISFMGERRLHFPLTRNRWFVLPLRGSLGAVADYVENVLLDIAHDGVGPEAGIEVKGSGEAVAAGEMQ